MIDRFLMERPQGDINRAALAEPLVGFVAFQAISEPAALGATLCLRRCEVGWRQHRRLSFVSRDSPALVPALVHDLKILLFLCAEIRCKMDCSLSVGDPS